MRRIESPQVQRSRAPIGSTAASPFARARPARAAENGAQHASGAGLGAAGPALLDTRHHLPRLTLQRVENTREGLPARFRAPRVRALDFPAAAAPAPAPRALPAGHVRVRCNRWSAASVARRSWVRRRVAEAYDRLGENERADAIRGCGIASVLYRPDGTPKLSDAGVPIMRRHKCGDRNCPDCAGDLSRRQSRVVWERLEELDDRRRFPVRPIPRRTRGVSIVARVARAKARIRAMPDAPSQVEPLQRSLVAVVRETEAARDGGGSERERAVVAHDVAERVHAANVRLAQPLGRLVFRWLPDGSLVASAPDVGESYAWPEESPHLKRTSIPKPRSERTGRPSRAFRVGRAADNHHEGARLASWTQDDIIGEGLSSALDRLQLSTSNMTESTEWKFYVDASVIRFEATWSTLATRRARALDLEKDAARHEQRGDHARAAKLRAEASDLRRRRGEWWHAHAHAVLWGRAWTQTTRLRHSDGEREVVPLATDFLSVWRRACKRAGNYREGARMYTVQRLVGHRYGLRFKREQLPRIGGARIEAIRMRHGEDERSTTRRALKEALKYATKPLAFALAPLTDWDDDGAPDMFRADVLTEAVQALRGRRLFRTTGLLYGCALPEDLEPSKESNEPHKEGPGEVWRSDDEAREAARLILERIEAEAIERWAQQREQREVDRVRRQRIAGAHAAHRDHRARAGPS
jgi:hypothetical protein